MFDVWVPLVLLHFWLHSGSFVFARDTAKNISWHFDRKKSWWVPRSVSRRRWEFFSSSTRWDKQTCSGQGLGGIGGVAIELSHWIIWAWKTFSTIRHQTHPFKIDQFCVTCKFCILHSSQGQLGPEWVAKMEPWTSPSTWAVEDLELLWNNKSSKLWRMSVSSPS